ncbi:uncharacterized protein AB675_5679 [Cyphellophora attinorum]|uniref:Uncharacterized protein n=1 Tax=Cyphellophora attinorum TaxID=1664694 RepID=A0A0N0NP18_9EURO|nr:uncharacterized protein AB675_5679 [Phialophora attinorum]KPI42198.1 hypothetical protein AB675_5679 [Phialophora attinorum]
MVERHGMLGPVEYIPDCLITYDKLEPHQIRMKAYLSDVLLRQACYDQYVIDKDFDHQIMGDDLPCYLSCNKVLLEREIRRILERPLPHPTRPKKYIDDDRLLAKLLDWNVACDSPVDITFAMLEATLKFNLPKCLDVLLMQHLESRFADKRLTKRVFSMTDVKNLGNAAFKMGYDFGSTIFEPLDDARSRWDKEHRHLSYENREQTGLRASDEDIATMQRSEWNEGTEHDAYAGADIEFRETELEDAREQLGAYGERSPDDVQEELRMLPGQLGESQEAATAMAAEEEEAAAAAAAEEAEDEGVEEDEAASEANEEATEIESEEEETDWPVEEDEDEEEEQEHQNWSETQWRAFLESDGEISDDEDFSDDDVGYSHRMHWRGGEGASSGDEDDEDEDIQSDEEQWAGEDDESDEGDGGAGDEDDSDAPSQLVMPGSALPKLPPIIP